MKFNTESGSECNLHDNREQPRDTPSSDQSLLASLDYKRGGDLVEVAPFKVKCRELCSEVLTAWSRSQTSRVSTFPWKMGRIKLERLMADFMALTTSVEKYLKQGRPLTPLQFESISLTVSMLQTFLNIWKSRYGSKIHLTKGKAPSPWFINAKSGSVLPANVNREKRHSAAVVLGRLGGLKGGKARAMKLSPRTRASIARAAATARRTKSLDANV